MTPQGAPDRFRRLLPMVIVVLVFLAPVTGSWLLRLSGWRSEHLVNYGTLVTPPKPVPAGAVDLERVGGGALDPHFLLGKWTLIQVDRTPCDTACAHRLWVTRQVRVTLGEDLRRVQRLLVFSGGRPDPHLAELRAAHPDLTIVGGSPQQLRTMFDWLNSGGGGPVDGHVYLVDPLGNLMMRYPADLKPSGLQKDLKRLLKVSHIG
ncbi:MAG: hypothetical protein B7Z66_10045 [Chromatiales bacterium 21-64-14]|nr:MAG: hypothetical protein B7Z66_10045 [Chromatiales bacterium 21-64-14]HQU16201.1 hypothetical protein [Gammaproteobacteria bacterium]